MAVYVDTPQPGDLIFCRVCDRNFVNHSALSQHVHKSHDRDGDWRRYVVYEERAATPPTEEATGA